MGQYTDGSGIARLSGAGTRWDVAQGLSVGTGGIGHVELTDGAVAKSLVGLVGESECGDGTVLVRGTETEWAVASHLQVGDRGQGDLDLDDGVLAGAGLVHGDVQANGIIRPYDHSPSGTARLTLHGSLWADPT